MDKYTATELAFKHGYEKGYEAGIAKEKKAYCDGLLDGRRAALECVPLAKWIPVSERLPDEDGTYIVRTTSGAVTTARFYKEMTFPPTAYRNE